MLTKSLALGVFVAAGVTSVGCVSGDDGAESDTSNLNHGAPSAPALFDEDLPVPDLNVPLTHEFKETLTRFGVTVTPELRASGTFGLKHGSVHVKVDYTANPPTIKKMDVLSRGTWSTTARFDLDVTADAHFFASADFRRSFSAGTSLGGKAFEIAKVPILNIPLPQAPTIQFQLALELAAECFLDFDAELHAFAEVGVEGLASADVLYNPTLPSHVGFVKNGDLSKQDQFHFTTPPRVAFKDGNVASLHGRCSLQPSLNATAALGVDPTHPLADVGVKFIAEPYAEFDGTFRSMADWTVDTKMGVAGSIAPFGDFFGRPFGQTIDFKIFDLELARGTSTPSP